MKYPEIEQIRKELEIPRHSRNEQMKHSVRIKCAQRALRLLAELEAKVAESVRVK